MKYEVRIRKAGNEKYRALQITIPADVVKAKELVEGQRFLVDFDDWEVLD